MRGFTVFWLYQKAKYTDDIDNYLGYGMTLFLFLFNETASHHIKGESLRRAVFSPDPWGQRLFILVVCCVLQFVAWHISPSIGVSVATTEGVPLLWSGLIGMHLRQLFVLKHFGSEDLREKNWLPQVLLVLGLFFGTALILYYKCSLTWAVTVLQCLGVFFGVVSALVWEFFDAAGVVKDEPEEGLLEDGILPDFYRYM